MELQDGTEIEFDIFKDIWTVYKKYCQVENTDEYWERLVQECHEVEKKHNSNLCQDLLITVLSELERKSKKAIS